MDSVSGLLVCTTAADVQLLATGYRQMNVFVDTK
jgi:hypothetical protein